MTPLDADHSERGRFDYTIEVCAICGCGLSMGIGPRSGRCINPEHHSYGGVVLRVRPLPAFQQPLRESTVRSLVRAGALPQRSNEPWPAASDEEEQR